MCHLKSSVRLFGVRTKDSAVEAKSSLHKCTRRKQEVKEIILKFDLRLIHVSFRPHLFWLYEL